MTRKLLFVLTLMSYMSFSAQEKYSLEEVRRDFQGIENEDDIERLLAIEVDSNAPEAFRVQAYQAAGTCMMAEYVFSPIKKLRYFNEGRESLERTIVSEKSVESVYCRLLVQLNVPRILNYHQHIEEDIEYLQAELPKAEIDREYKQTMIRNLVTLADKEDVKRSLLGIDLAGDKEKS